MHAGGRHNSRRKEGLLHSGCSLELPAVMRLSKARRQAGKGAREKTTAVTSGEATPWSTVM